MAGIKNKSLKKKLEKKAEKNARVTKGTSQEQEVLKEGVPNDHSRKHSGGKTVGVNVGVTLNMQDYNSLRVDTWLTDEVQEDETFEQAYDRIFAIADKKLQEIVDVYKD